MTDLATKEAKKKAAKEADAPVNRLAEGSADAVPLTARAGFQDGTQRSHGRAHGPDWQRIDDGTTDTATAVRPARRQSQPTIARPGNWPPLTEAPPRGISSDPPLDALSMWSSPPWGLTPLRARDVSAMLDGTQVLHGVSVEFTADSWTAIVGPNGAGKSTLLRVLAGLLEHSEGRLELMGRPLRDWSERERAQRLAWLPQQTEVPIGLGVRDVVELGRLPHLGLFDAPGEQDEAAVNGAMALAECTAFSQRRVSSLSGGERQRVMLARALAVQAPLLLLDEPTTHLDPPHQVSLVRMLRRLARGAGLALVSVLHDLSLALQADRLLVMANGHVQADGACDDPIVRQALTDVFEGAVHIVNIATEGVAQWVAVPRVESPGGAGERT